jgi:hypothetical protein
MVTEERLLVPPAPVQVREYVVGTDNAPVLSVPLAALAPLQAPDAVQLVALVELQLSVATPPAETAVGLAVSTAVGTTLIVTSTGLLAPPAPVQDSAYVVLIASGAVACAPLAASAPLQPPDAVQAVAFVDDQVSVDAAPATTTCGLADSTAVAATLTVAFAGALVPPGPEHVTL